jgi:hypothetical protein
MPFIIPVNNPNTITADGETVDISNWLANFDTIYNFVNASLVAQFNLMQYAGDLITNNGTAITCLTTNGVTDGDVLVKRSSAANGIDWETPPGIPINTAGDILYYNSGNQRLGIGTATQVLTVSGGTPALPVWANASGIPAGIISMWSGSVASIPSGWVLCNGMNGTPNLQGVFVVGAGNSSPAATNGMGLIAPNMQGGDTSSGVGIGASYTPVVSGNVNGTTSGPSSAANINAGVSPAAASGSHTHTFSANFSTNTNPFVVTPVYYTLCYIMST